jgi:hypothetical protein
MAHLWLHIYADKSIVRRLNDHPYFLLDRNASQPESFQGRQFIRSIGKTSTPKPGSSQPMTFRAGNNTSRKSHLAIHQPSTTKMTPNVHQWLSSGNSRMAQSCHSTSHLGHRNLSGISQPSSLRHFTTRGDYPIRPCLGIFLPKSLPNLIDSTSISG